VGPEKCGRSNSELYRILIYTAVRVHIPACLGMSGAEWGRTAEAINGKV